MPSVDPLLHELELSQVVIRIDHRDLVEKATPVDRECDEFVLRSVAPPVRAGVAPLIETFVLVDRGQDDRLLSCYNLRHRSGIESRSYGRRHLTLSSFDAPQELNPVRLMAGLLMLGELVGKNEKVSGFFNGFAPSHDGLHFQYIHETLPIWTLVDADPQRPRLLGGSVSVTSLGRWAFLATCYSSSEPHHIVEVVWTAIQDDLASYDLLLYGSPGRFCCIPVRRRRPKPMAMSIVHPDRQGNVGGAELSGLIIVTDQSQWEPLVADLQTAAVRVRAALREVVAGE